LKLNRRLTALITVALVGVKCTEPYMVTLIFYVLSILHSFVFALYLFFFVLKPPKHIVTMICLHNANTSYISICYSAGADPGGLGGLWGLKLPPFTFGLFYLAIG